MRGQPRVTLSPIKSTYEQPIKPRQEGNGLDSAPNDALSPQAAPPSRLVRVALPLAALLAARAAVDAEAQPHVVLGAVRVLGLDAEQQRVELASPERCALSVLAHLSARAWRVRRI